jgi:arginine decarboxylase
LRPELDLYLMTEIEVEDIAGRLGQHFRRVFHAHEGVLELHLSILAGVFHALPISQGKSIVNSHWIKDMVGFTASTCSWPRRRPPAVGSTR